MIVTLCGSTRFEADFIAAQRELSLRGILCFSLAVLPQHRLPDEDWADGSISKVMADLLYFQRIQHSAAILVLGDGYVGQSCAREILWAGIQEKAIYAQSRELWHELIGKLYDHKNSWDAIASRLQTTRAFDDSSILLQKAREVFA